MLSESDIDGSLHISPLMHGDAELREFSAPASFANDVRRCFGGFSGRRRRPHTFRQKAAFTIVASLMAILVLLSVCRVLTRKLSQPVLT